MAASGHIDVLKFFPRRKLDERFEPLGRVEASEELGHDFISADNAVFGFVLERRNGIQILESSSETTTLDGEPVNWRVFPRSRYYTNHLHVVREEYLSVLSFNGDFFVNQKSKVAGVEYKPSYQFSRGSYPERPKPVNIGQFEDDELTNL